MCDNVDEPGNHEAKWKKADAERQVLHDLTCKEPESLMMVSTG